MCKNTKRLTAALKKVFAVILSLVLALSVFAGCGNENITETQSNTSVLVNFKSNLFDIEVGTTQNVRFTVEANFEGESGTISLCSDNQTLGTMTDDGQNGDYIANDGIYSCAIDLTAETKKKVDYYAVCNEAQSNSFTISFYQIITEDEYQNFSELSSRVDACDTYKSAYQIISTAPNITVITADEATQTILYETEYGLSGMWQARQDGYKSGRIAVDDVRIPASDEAYGDIYEKIDQLTVGAFSGKKGVLVLRPFRNNGFYYDDFLYAGAALAKASNGPLDLYDDAEADLDTFKSFNNYGTVLVDSHGALVQSTKKTYIVSGEMANYETVRENSADLNCERLIISNGKYLLNSSFFDKYYPTRSLEDTTVFLGTCYSAYNDSFGSTLMQKGAPLVLGYSDTVSVTYCNQTLYAFMVENMLLSGLEAEKAFENTIRTCGKSDGSAEFVMYKSGDAVRLFDLDYQSGNGEILSFTTPDSLNIVLGEAGAIEPEINAEKDVQYTISWTSSDPDVVNVNAEGTVGVLNTLSSGQAIVTATLTTDSDVFTASTTVEVAPVARDVVLVLDCSGSMGGTPFYEMQKVADQFCSDILENNSQNRVAIVYFETNVYSTKLTSDIASLRDYIQQLSTTGVTNTQGALECAGQILDDYGADGSVKNIIIMTDGLPNAGATSNSGSFVSTSNYYGYATDDLYANAVVDTAKDLMSKYNLYSLGFFHSLDGETLAYGSELVSQLTNQENGYYQVEDASNLQFAFGDIGETITDGSKIIINVACPVDVKVSCNGEYLSSDADDFKDSAAFGTLSILGKNDDIKIFSLDNQNVYDIDFQGTGEGTMDLSMNYYDSDNNLYDTRAFSKVPLSNSVAMTSSTDNSNIVALQIDSDGDGQFDDIWEAGTNSLGSSSTQKQPEYQVISSNSGSNTEIWQICLIVGCAVVLLLMVSIGVPVIIKREHRKEQQGQYEENGSALPEYNNYTGANQRQGDTEFVNPVSHIQPLPVNVHKFKVNIPSIGISQEYSIVGEQSYCIGKDPAWANIVLPKSFVKISRKHCVITFDASRQKFVVNDMSTNGLTYSNGKKLDKGINYVSVGESIIFPEKKCLIQF